MAIADTMKGMGKIKVGIIAGIAILMFAAFMIFALRMSTGGQIPLFTGLSLEDSNKIVTELDKASIPYELAANGTEIMVPADRVLRLRMTMAEQGLPSGGSIVGYEIFDRSESFGSSSFVMNVNMTRALEGELSRTIASLSDVDSARVHLVMPKRELFTREKDAPSASVTIKMRGDHALEHSEVMAVTHLIASAVPGLQASKVTVVDSHGRLLARGDGDQGLDATASSAAEYRTTYQNHMQQTLEDLLEKVIGAGKVRVQVAADINFDRTVTNSEKYDPEGQVARSTQSNSERDTAQDKSGKDSVSVANNLPKAADAGGGDGNTSNHLVDRSDETTNYEISKTVQNHISEGGSINKMSVAVLVDGTYPDNADGKATYTPRSEEELKQLKTLVSSAIGYDEKRGDKIEVVNMRFTQDSLDTGNNSFFDRFRTEMQGILQTLIIGVVAILAILLVLRPAVNQMIRQSQTPSDRVSNDLAALEGPGGNARIGNMGGGGMPGDGSEPEMLIDVANIKGGMKSSSMKKINEIVDKYPEETMSVLRNWVLKQS
jgi:flagellar M-ring protein FliF